MLSSRADRTGRGLVAAAIAVLVAVLSHSIADGRPAPLLGILLTLVFAVPLCVALAGRELSWIRLSLAVGLSQFVFHGLLLIGITDPAALPAATDAAAAATAQSAHAAHTAQALLPGIASVGPAAHAAHAGVGMWIAHLIGAAVTVAALGAGEQALRALLDLFGWDRLLRVLNWVPSPQRAAVRIAAAWRFTAPKLVVLTEMRLRGPPLPA
ncbi:MULTISPECIES: hypothetical protein [unclassified Leucobacter]|uniref:hypothetical protein n=1 Tax=unclassified Leucobacter TaxID=2621730 RepID=UPI00069AF270|nr:hypothetical protein [Leucobacter sp. Ag1]